MPNAQKQEKVADLRERIDGSQAVLLADFRGLTVHEATELRDMLRPSGTRFAVVKNTLMKRAADLAGMESLISFLEGPTAVAFIEGDPVVAAKKIVEAAKKFPALVLKGGFMEGRLLSPDDARALAELDSREVMLSKVAGMLKSQMSRAARGFQAHQSRFLSLLEAFKAKLPADVAADVAEAVAGAVEAVEQAVEEVVADAIAEELVAEGAEPEAAAEVAEAIAEEVVTEEMAEVLVAEAIVEAVAGEDGEGTPEMSEPGAEAAGENGEE